MSITTPSLFFSPSLSLTIYVYLSLCLSYSVSIYLSLPVSLYLSTTLLSLSFYKIYISLSISFSFALYLYLIYLSISISLYLRGSNYYCFSAVPLATMNGGTSECVVNKVNMRSIVIHPVFLLKISFEYLNSVPFHEEDIYGAYSVLAWRLQC